METRRLLLFTANTSMGWPAIHCETSAAPYVAAQKDPHAMPVLLQKTLLLVCSNVFMTFAVLSMKQPLKLNHLRTALCICAAVYFLFRES